jgi:hypothetical protein
VDHLLPSPPQVYDHGVLSAAEIEDLLQAGYETRGFELKGPGSRTDSHLMAKVTRAALSLGNLRDGGHIVIGIDDKNPASLGPGLSSADLASWTSYDDVARKMAEYADPAVSFDISFPVLSSGAEVAVLQVHEFEDLPHLCSKQYDPVLRKGALYVRSRKLPETAEVASSVEMREVLQLATEKALRGYVETAQRAGVGLASSNPNQVLFDEARFEAQRQVAW